MRESRALVTVAQVDTIAEAAVIQAMLESAGIRVTADGAGLIGLDWSLSQALGGVRLQVPGDRAEEALGLIDAYRRGALAAGDDIEAAPPEERCPRCGSATVRAVAANREKGLLVLMTALFGAMFPTSDTHRRCDDCGARWPAERNARDAAR